MPGDKVTLDGNVHNPKVARAIVEELVDLQQKKKLNEKQFPNQMIISCGDTITYYFLKGEEYKVGTFEDKKLVKLPGTIQLKTVLKRLDTMCFGEKNSPAFSIHDEEDEEYSQDFDSLDPSPKLASLKYKAEQIQKLVQKHQQRPRSASTPKKRSKTVKKGKKRPYSRRKN